MIVWLTLAAVAAEPADLEITVWGELAIQKARDDIVRAMEADGWRAKRKDGRIVFKGPSAWMGAAILTDEGMLDFRAPVLGLTGKPPEEWAVDPRHQDLANAGPNDLDPEIGLGPNVTVGSSKRKLEPVRARVQAAIADELDAFLAVKRRTAFEEALLVLPDRLDAVWKDGVPLKAGPPLPDATARRRAVLEHWATRAETAEGVRTCRAIEAWLEATVQESESPIPDEERAEYEARRTDGRTLP